MIHPLKVFSFLVFFFLLSATSHAEKREQKEFIEIASLDELEELIEFGHSSVPTKDMIPLAVSPELAKEMLKYGYEPKVDWWNDHKRNLICNVALFTLLGLASGINIQKDTAYSLQAAASLGAAAGAISGASYYAMSRILLGGLSFLRSAIGLPGNALPLLEKWKRNQNSKPKDAPIQS